MNSIDFLGKLALTPPSAAGARTAALSSLCSLLRKISLEFPKLLIVQLGNFGLLFYIGKNLVLLYGLDSDV